MFMFRIVDFKKGHTIIFNDVNKACLNLKKYIRQIDIFFETFLLYNYYRQTISSLTI